MQQSVVVDIVINLRPKRARVDGRLDEKISTVAQAWPKIAST